MASHHEDLGGQFTYKYSCYGRFSSGHLKRKPESYDAEEAMQRPRYDLNHISNEILNLDEAVKQSKMTGSTKDTAITLSDEEGDSQGWLANLWKRLPDFDDQRDKKERPRSDITDCITIYSTDEEEGLHNISSTKGSSQEEPWIIEDPPVPVTVPSCISGKQSVQEFSACLGDLTKRALKPSQSKDLTDFVKHNSSIDDDILNSLREFYGDILSPEEFLSLTAISDSGSRTIVSEAGKSSISAPSHTNSVNTTCTTSLRSIEMESYTMPSIKKNATEKEKRLILKTVLTDVKKDMKRESTSESKRYFFINPGSRNPEVRKTFDAFLWRHWNTLQWPNMKGNNQNKCWHWPKTIYNRATIHGVLSARDSLGITHKVKLPVGVVPLFLQGSLTDEMIQGYIYDGWHLSHLCGNWTCCNPAHHTVETNRVNQSRKRCHNGRVTQCPHRPRCLAHLTVDTPMIKRPTSKPRLESKLGTSSSSQGSDNSSTALGGTYTTDM